MSKKAREYRNQIEALTTRLTTCRLDDFGKVEDELARVKRDAIEYERKLQEKRSNRQCVN